jgi:hypothetical protein
MLEAVLGMNEGLVSAGRLGALTRAGQRVSVLEFAAMMTCGALAALAAAFIDTPWQIPGQSIVQSVVPMALGLALVPRRAAGSVMGVGSVLTVACLRTGGFHGIGFGAMTSLFLTGPMLDLAVWNARGGWRLYLRVIVAGLTTNVLALLIRLATKLLSGDLSGGRRLASWLPEAIFTYPMCGVLAGLIGAMAWFHWATRQPGDPRENAP